MARKITPIGIASLLCIGIAVGSIIGYVSFLGDLNTLKAQNAVLTNQVVGLRADNTILSSEVTSLQSDKSGLQSQVSSLSSDKSSLQTQVSNLQSQASSLEKEKINLQAQMESLQSQLNSASHSSSALASQITSLKQQISILNNTIQILKTNSTISVNFSPKGGCAAKVIYWIGRANKTVHILIYDFTLDSIGNATIAAYKKGLDVKIVFEKEQNTKYSEYFRLQSAGAKAGVQIRNDTNSAIMHDKVAIIDGHIILTGSYNWTSNAENSNNENLIVIDSAQLAATYEKEFSRIWTTGK